MRRWAIATVILAAAIPAHAFYDQWVVNEIYSNADGSVQFIELRAVAGSQHEVSGVRLKISDTIGTTHLFTFTNDLPSSSTFQRTMLLATPAFASQPGAVTPDFIIEPNFLLIPEGTIEYPEGEPFDVATYSNLPTDGIASLVRSPNNQLVLNATNSPRNFAGQTGSIRPGLRLLAPTAVPAGFVFSFNTSTGKTYSIEASDAIMPTNWQNLFSLPGTGSSATVTNSTVTPITRFYRVRVN
jgi:hypothetical protein